MTALVFENLTILPLHARSLRLLLTRWMRVLNRLVSARAARQIPEWRMRQVQSEIDRYMPPAESGRRLARRSRPTSSAARCL